MQAALTSNHDCAHNNDASTIYILCFLEKDEWIGAIGRAIVQSSATFTNEDGIDPDNCSDSDDD